MERPYLFWARALSRTQLRGGIYSRNISAVPTIGIAVTVAAAVAILMQFLDGWIVTGVRQLPREYFEFFDVVTDYGRSAWVLVPIVSALVVLIGISTCTSVGFAKLVVKSASARLWFLFLAIALPGLFTSLGKHLVGRARPYVTGGDAHMFAPFAWRSEYASLPSGHSTTAFAAAVAIGAVWPRYRIPVWIYALAIGTSRVIVNAHFVSDVILSAGIGIIGALIVRNYFARRGRVFIVGRNGDVRSLPGASMPRILRAVRSLRLQSMPNRNPSQ